MSDIDVRRAGLGFGFSGGTNPAESGAPTSGDFAGNRNMDCGLEREEEDGEVGEVAPGDGVWAGALEDVLDEEWREWVCLLADWGGDSNESGEPALG